MVKIIEDDTLFDKIPEYDAILIGTNTYGMMGNGFPRKAMLHYPYILDDNLKTKYGDKDKMGTLLECKRDGQPVFVLCYITMGYNFRPDLNPDYLSYESLEKCLRLINIIYKDKKVACTLLGSSRFDGNGDRNKIIEIFNECCTDVDLTIYDYFQKSASEESKEIRMKELAVKAKDRDTYYKMVRERKERENKLKELNGHAKY